MSWPDSLTRVTLHTGGIEQSSPVPFGESQSSVGHPRANRILQAVVQKPAELVPRIQDIQKPELPSPHQLPAADTQTHKTPLQQFTLQRNSPPEYDHIKIAGLGRPQKTNNRQHVRYGKSIVAKASVDDS